MTVLHFVRFMGRESFTLIKDKNRIHIIRKETDLNAGRNELHWAIIADLIGTNSSIFTDFTIDAIKEAVIEPLSGLKDMRVTLCISEALQWSIVDAGMNGNVTDTYVILEHSVKLSQQGDMRRVEGVKPTFLQGAPLPFHLLYECSYKESNMFDRASQISG